MEIDTDRIDEAVLALLYLGLHDRYRVWKGFDWNAMDRLHEKGLISDPVGKAKSVVFTEEGLRARPSASFASCSRPAAERSRAPLRHTLVRRSRTSGLVSHAVGVGHPRGEAELLELADVPPLEVDLGPRLAARAHEHDPLVLQPAAPGHLGEAAGEHARAAVHVLDLPPHEPVALRFSRHDARAAGAAQ